MRSGLTVRRMLWGTFALQLLLAGILMARDFTAALPYMAWPSTQPSLQTPVLPGDQTRRYRPRDTPLGPTRPDAPARPYTNTSDMPQRLAFEQESDVLTLTGAISPGDAERFTETLEGMSGVTQIRLNSPGGSVRDALDIGRAIRDAEFDVVAGATDICLSACPYVLASGIARRVHADAQVGVHQHSFGTNTVLPAFLAVEDIQRGQGEVMTYLDEMGVGPLLMRHALATPPDEIYILLTDQLLEYELATEIIDN
ncbi:hypothetical protein [Litoreibacter roseus]|uniref:Clp protease n=1 Tax=Litoreibacter roseus TaxID=2601869 RepID=A0A6N6JIW1_9RHOB|nr:hypothetical protein [Litoreibacter roseus]GFE65359.1 hypothetical protein KIN_24330 [Litoreibacter roseus]